jgi:hypothetical protein
MSEIRYITRDALGRIDGSFASRQEAPTEEMLDDHPDHVAFMATFGLPPPPPKAADGGPADVAP